tara:strand:+ start:136 stop:438 length:303 start_codon:yes stop_codon:yes gene_type:complete
MSKTHVEVVVFDGIEEASELLVGTFDVVEKLKYLENDQETSDHGSYILLIEEEQIHENGYRNKQYDNANQYEYSKAIKAHISQVFGTKMNGLNLILVPHG